jgi:hypothetical protein
MTFIFLIPPDLWHCDKIRISIFDHSSAASPKKYYYPTLKRGAEGIRSRTRGKAHGGPYSSSYRRKKAI